MHEVVKFPALPTARNGRVRRSRDIRLHNFYCGACFVKRVTRSGRKKFVRETKFRGTVSRDASCMRSQPVRLHFVTARILPQVGTQARASAPIQTRGDTRERSPESRRDRVRSGPAGWTHKQTETICKTLVERESDRLAGEGPDFVEKRATTERHVSRHRGFLEVPPRRALLSSD